MTGTYVEREAYKAKSCTRDTPLFIQSELFLHTGHWGKEEKKKSDPWFTRRPLPLTQLTCGAGPFGRR